MPLDATSRVAAKSAECFLMFISFESRPYVNVEP